MSIFNHFRKLTALQLLRTQLPQPAAIASSMCSSATTKGITLEYERDPQPFFTDPETQRLLQSMTQLQLEKVLRQRTLADNSVDYKFMTTEQLEKEFVGTIEKARHRLQMPPVVAVKEDEHRIISKDAALRGFSDTKYVFTDITYGLRQSERKVVVRQTDGTLEYAPLETTKRVNQVYFPQAGRKLRTPRMFEPEHLDRCLAERKYEFILDRMLAQYEPYEPEFHRISARVYQHLNEESRDFDSLRSTRHFGPMAFFYAWHRCIDDLLYDMVRRDFLRNGAELIALVYKIHNIQGGHDELLQQLESHQPEVDPVLAELRKSIQAPTEDIQQEISTAIGKTRADFASDELCLKLIEQYIAEHALKKVQLELAVQTLKEINAEKKQLFEGLNKAHGIQQ